jgi:exonuclease III
MSRLRILQYNVQKSKDKVMLPLIDGPHDPYDVIAIQEPWLNPYMSTTYCPRSSLYHLVFCGTGRTRACLYVSKAIPISKWKAGAEQDYCWVRIETDIGLITVHCVYSEIPASHRTTEWDTPILQVLEAVQDGEQHVVVGDFNLHHPLWGGPRVQQAHAGAEPLLRSIESGELELLLQPGTITREKHGNEPSTLDLSLCTPGLAARVARCKVTDAHGGSDHRPIETEFIIGNPVYKDPKPTMDFRKMDTEAVEDGAKWLQVLTSEEQATSQGIDQYVDYLVGFVQDLIHKTVPTRKGASLHSKSWWTQEAEDLVQAEQRAHREWTRRHSSQAWEDLERASIAKRKGIASAKQAHWRRKVHEASISTEGIWKLAKWARTKSFLPAEPPQMPDMQWQGTTYSTIEGKAEALCGRFYPNVQADTSDVEPGLRQLGAREELEMEQRVVADDIRAILRSIKPDKGPGIDEIPNRFLQAMGEPLVNAMQSLITAVIKLSYFPQRFRSARTIVLRKPRKPDYSDPGAWRPIALLSTIGKLIETLLARRLGALAEQEGLLPDTQMGNRRNRSTDTALDLLLEQIHTVWHEKDHVASVLSLDIAGAFDTVNHVRLLDNLQAKRVPL